MWYGDFPSVTATGQTLKVEEEMCPLQERKGDLLCQGHIRMLPPDACSGSEALMDCASVQGGLGSAVCLANARQF